MNKYAATAIVGVWIRLQLFFLSPKLLDGEVAALRVVGVDRVFEAVGTTLSMKQTRLHLKNNKQLFNGNSGRKCLLAFMPRAMGEVLFYSGI